MFKKIKMAGIMCLALANSAAAKGAAGTGAGGVVIGAVVVVAAVAGWGQFRAYNNQIKLGLSNFNTVESVETWPHIGLFGFTKVYLVNRR